MLQKLPGSGCGRQRRLGRRLACASSPFGAPARCCSFPPKTPWPSCANAWKASPRRLRSAFESLPVEVITAPSLRLDTPTDRQRLSNTVRHLRPILLILDPLIRLHRVDENDATQIAALLSFLRELQRQFQLGRAIGSSRPQRLQLLAARAKPCAAPVNFTAGATPISTCAGEVHN